MYKNLVIAILLMGCFGCKSPKEKTILENFKSVDSSLNKTSESMRTVAKIKTIDTTGKLLTTVFDSARYLIHVLKRKLNILDPSGERMGPSDSLILDKETEMLYEKMRRIYSMDTASEMKLTMSKDQWRQRYFRSVPTYASHTLLSKFNLDIILIEQRFGNNSK